MKSVDEYEGFCGGCIADGGRPRRRLGRLVGGAVVVELHRREGLCGVDAGELRLWLVGFIWRSVCSASAQALGHLDLALDDFEQYDRRRKQGG